MTANRGLSESEYLDIVGNIQKAMVIVPFQPHIADVVALIGAWRLQQHEVEQLERQMRAHRETAVAAIAGADKQIHELQAALTAALEQNERLLVELTHRVGWEERCLRAEAEIERLRAALAEIGGPHSLSGGYARDIALNALDRDKDG